jgi:hypothetical protein
MREGASVPMMETIVSTAVRKARMCVWMSSRVYLNAQDRKSKGRE